MYLHCFAANECCQKRLPADFTDHQNTECRRKYLKLQRATCTCFQLPSLQQEGFDFFCGPDSTSLHMQNNIPACFLKVPNACVKLALIKPQSLFWENTVQIVRFNNRLNYRPAAVLQTKLTDITSLLDSGSQNSIDLHQWCIDTGYGRALEKLKTSFTLIFSEWLH